MENHIGVVHGLYRGNDKENGNYNLGFRVRGQGGSGFGIRVSGLGLRM